MIKTLIVDDESSIRIRIKTLLNSFDHPISIIGECESVQEATTIIDACKPDLLLLDINIKGGTAFDILKQIKITNYKVIFMTAYEEYAFKAIKNGAIDYLLKPINLHDLKIALSKVTQLSPSINDIETLHNKRERLVLSLQDSLQIIDFKDLLYCQSDGGYTTFYLTDKRTFIASKPLKDFEKLLPKCTFIRTHQSYIVNLDYIDRYDKSRYVFLKNNSKIPVSIRKKEDFIATVL